jgi:two-component system, cell cycle sensor histidine kinase and response regulator CckA
MAVSDGSRAGFETARLKLARLRIEGDDARVSAMNQLARISAQTLGVERVGVWLFEDDGRRLRNVTQYQLSADAHLSGEELDVLAYPAFLGGLRERRVIAASDVRTHPLTREFPASYLARHGISSRLDAGIIRGGALTGIVCHEHAGPARIWSQKDRDFAASSADMAALFFEQADRLEIETALHARREDQLVQDKMSALGRLARTIAHDVNNVFGVISLAGSLLQQRSEADVRASGASIGKAVELGARLIAQLSLFGNEAPPAPARVDLGFIIQRMRPVLVELMRGARLEIDVATQPATVLASESEMEQVVLNLCVNAAEAVLPGRGVVRIELRDPRPDEPINPAALVLTVEDDGAGMDRETLAHAFEPYFTRKGNVGGEAGKGGERGIGLAVVYGIVKRARGTVSATSTPGHGTTFTVVLPRAVGAPPSR